MQFNSTDQAQNLIYLYDLPKDETDSRKIAIAFKEMADVILDSKPQIRKDITRPFYSAIVCIKDPEAFAKSCEAMKYFKIGGKQCRGLQFDRLLLGGENRSKMMSNNVFISKIPKDLEHSDLQMKFEKIGKIKSLKISLNPDHSSRGYGFICFHDEIAASKAVEVCENDGSTVAIKFEPKDKRQYRKLVNNIYVKNIPLDYSND